MSPISLLWVGPSGVAQNGIARDSEKIIPYLEGRVTVSRQTLNFGGRRIGYPLQVVRAVSALTRSAFSGPKPLVHIQYCPFSTGPGAIAVALAARTLGLKTVTTLHENKKSALRKRSFSSKSKGVFWTLYPYVEDVIYRLSDAIIVHSNGQMLSLPEKARARASTVEFGMEPCSCVPEPVTSSPIVGCFGLLQPYKGIETVIEACAQAAVPGLKLVIVGGVPPSSAAYVEDLESMARARLSDRVEIVRNAPEAEFERLLHQVTMVCFGFRDVTQSGTLYRALGHGRPVTATEDGAAEIIVRERLGAVVPVDDPAAMAGAIERLLLDRYAYAAARRAVSDYARRRTWAASAEDHYQLYARLAGGALRDELRVAA